MGVKTKVQVNIDYKKIMNSRGLGQDREATKWLANMFALRCNKRVPMQKGTLKNQHEIVDLGEGEGAGILYTQPYAHYQYEGRVMGPNYTDGNGRFWSGEAPKRYTGKKLTYHQGPMRGSKWDVRTKQAEGRAILKSFAAHVGGKPK